MKGFLFRLLLAAAFSTLATLPVEAQAVWGDRDNVRWESRDDEDSDSDEDSDEDSDSDRRRDDRWERRDRGSILDVILGRGRRADRRDAADRAHEEWHRRNDQRRRDRDWHRRHEELHARLERARRAR